MAIVDEQGRLFGRLNLLDAVLLVLLAGLVPLGYAAYIHELHAFPRRARYRRIAII